MALQYVEKKECISKLESRITDLYKVINEFMNQYDKNFGVLWNMRQEKYYQETLGTAFAKASYEQLYKLLRLLSKEILKYTILTTFEDSECWEDEKGRIYVEWKGYRI